MALIAAAKNNHANKALFFVLVVLGIIIFNMAAATDDTPIQWEYKTMIFKVELGNELTKYRTEFQDALNREARQGWELVGPCAHLTGERFGIDYIVLKRPRPVY